MFAYCSNFKYENAYGQLGGDSKLTRNESYMRTTCKIGPELTFRPELRHTVGILHWGTCHGAHVVVNSDVTRLKMCRP